MRKKKLKRQYGVTFLEILAVLIILVLIYLAYSRSFGQGTDKAKVSGVQNTFKFFQPSFESALNENSGLPQATGITGENADYFAINNYLPSEYKIASPHLGDTTTFGQSQYLVNPPEASLFKDPWGSPYIIQAKYDMDSSDIPEMFIVVRSYGKDKKTSVGGDASYYNPNYMGMNFDADDILMVTSYFNGMAKSCTKGLSKDLGTINFASGYVYKCQ